MSTSDRETIKLRTIIMNFRKRSCILDNCGMCSRNQKYLKASQNLSIVDEGAERCSYTNLPNACAFAWATGTGPIISFHCSIVSSPLTSLLRTKMIVGPLVMIFTNSSYCSCSVPAKDDSQKCKQFKHLQLFATWSVHEL